MSYKTIEHSFLGKKTTYVDQYDSTLLYPIMRIPQAYLMYGYDLWNLYEISWLNLHNKPEVAIGKLAYSYSSLYLIESKSLKLYLNSFNNSQFSSASHVQDTIKNDLSTVLNTDVFIELYDINSSVKIIPPQGKCLDDIHIEVKNFNFNDRMHSLVNIIENHTIVTEKLYSNLLRSNCPITQQPDWGTITVEYTGKQISHQSLLHYILCYRNHNDFHEHCIENIYCELMQYLCPTELNIYANYTRRGGIDINPYRSSEKLNMQSILTQNRLIRQ